MAAKTILQPCKVVVVDDQQKEGLPLVKSLNELGIPTLYYEGHLDGLPKIPNSGIRLVFLDMKLKGMDTQSNETIVSALMNVIKQVIAINNGPYVLFAWTQHPELLKVFKEHLKQRGKDIPKPCFTVDMEKSDCLDDKDELDYEKVSNALKKELEDLSVFNFFVEWEKTIGNSCSEVTNLINSLASETTKEKWVQELEELLYCMAKEDSGKHLGTTISLDESASNVLNTLLTDYVERNINSNNLLKTPSGSLGISDEKKAKINTTIHVKTIDPSTAPHAPGNLYILDFDKLKEFFNYIPYDEPTFKAKFFESKADLSKIKLCILEISPICDYTYKKWKCNRFLLGIIVPKDDVEKLWQNAKYLHRTPLLFLDDSACHVVFDFHYFAGTHFDLLTDLEPKYQIRLDLLSYIQNELMKHITRPGLFGMF